MRLDLPVLFSPMMQVLRCATRTSISFNERKFFITIRLSCISSPAKLANAEI